MSSAFPERLDFQSTTVQEIVCHHHKSTIHSSLFAPLRSSDSFFPCYIFGITVSIGNYRSKNVSQKRLHGI